MADEIKKPMTVDELMEHLKDPALLHAAAAKHGMKIVDPKEAPAVLPPPKKRVERPKFQVPEGGDISDIISAVGTFLEQQTNYLEDHASSKSEEVRGEFQMSEKRKELDRIHAFAKEHPDFNELLPIIGPLYDSGKFDLKEAYDTAKKTKAEPEKKTDTPNPVETPRSSVSSSFKSSDEGGAAQLNNLTPKHNTVRDAAKSNLAKLVASNPGLQTILDEGNNDE